MVSSPSVQAELLDHSEQFKNGVAMLWFTIPKTAKTKLLKGAPDDHARRPVGS